MPFDRLTELQDQLNFLSHMMYTCIGVIQRDAPPVKLQDTEESEALKKFDEMVKDMATQVVATVKRIDELIDSLPCMDSPEEQQIEAFADLEDKNKQVARQLEIEVENAELCLKQVREALKVITEDRFTKT